MSFVPSGNVGRLRCLIFLRFFVNFRRADHDLKRITRIVRNLNSFLQYSCTCALVNDLAFSFSVTVSMRAFGKDNALFSFASAFSSAFSFLASEAF